MKNIIGFDMGMGALKLWGHRGGYQMVSQVASNGQAQLTDGILGLKSRKRPMLVHGDFGSFYVGENAHEHGRPVENLDFDRLTGAPEMRALFYAALAKYQETYGSFDGPLSVMVGLPLQMMSGGQSQENAKAVRAWITGEHRFAVDHDQYQVKIETVKQTSQPVGALFDFVLDHEGRIIPENGYVLSEEVGVISLGFNTVELLVVKDRRAVEVFTRGNTLGVRRLLELINRDNLYTLSELDETLRAGGLRAEIKKALPIWAREINGEIEKVWGVKHRRFARVLIVGGGALLLREALTNQFAEKSWSPADPVLATARGLEKLAIMLKI